MNLLFWNLGGEDRTSIVFRLVLRHSVDLLMLAECPVPLGSIVHDLNLGTGLRFSETSSTCERIAILVGFNPQEITTVLDAERFTIRRVSPDARPDFLLVGAHLPSKREWSHESQSFQILEFASAIRHTEQRIGHSRTIVAGDLNVNPFEPGVVAANGLHAVMTQDLAVPEGRIVQATRYPFFYNPMWGRFGDTTAGPPGTYFHRRSEQVSYFWNIFDQVLVRPDLLPHFGVDDLTILTSDGETSFLNANGRPDRKLASDHLPLLFRLNFGGE